MERVDLQYLCTAIGNLSGIPVRVYENGIQTFYTSMVDLPKDPLTARRRSLPSQTMWDIISRRNFTTTAF